MKEKMKNTQKEIERLKSECDKMRAWLPKGPWTEEPDRITFKHKGFDCLMVRVPNHFSWCGYVGVSEGHPAYKKAYRDLEFIAIHGGLTYAKMCSGAICHITKEEDKLWWLGFDCAHSGDLCPGMEYHPSMVDIKKEFHERIRKMEEDLGSSLPKDIYRDMNYTMSQVKSLANQLSEMKNENTNTSRP